MERQDVIAKLKGLREEFEQAGYLLYTPIPPVLVLSDVCEALGLSKEEHNGVMGEEVAEDIEAWLNARMWQPVEKETAAQPITKLAAVPA